MKAEKNRNFLHKLYISGDGEDWDSFEELEAELTRIEELAAKGPRAEQAEREIEAEIKSHTERADYADRAGDKEESQRLWDMVAGLYIALDKVTGESADILKERIFIDKRLDELNNQLRTAEFLGKNTSLSARMCNAPKQQEQTIS